MSNFQEMSIQLLKMWFWVVPPWKLTPGLVEDVLAHGREVGTR